MASKIPTVFDTHRVRLQQVLDTARIERDRIDASSKFYTDDYRGELAGTLKANTANRLAALAADAAASAASAHQRLAAKRADILATDDASWNFARLQVQREEIAARIEANTGRWLDGSTRESRLEAAVDEAMKSGDRHLMRATAGVVEGKVADLDPVRASTLVEKIRQVEAKLAPPELADVDAALDQLRTDAETYKSEVYALESQFDDTGWRNGRLGSGMWGSNPSPVAKALGDVPPPPKYQPDAETFQPSAFQALVGVRS